MTLSALDIFVAWFVWNIGAPLAFIMLIGVIYGIFAWRDYKRKAK